MKADRFIRWMWTSKDIATAALASRTMQGALYAAKSPREQTFSREAHGSAVDAEGFRCL